MSKASTVSRNSLGKDSTNITANNRTPLAMVVQQLAYSIQGAWSAVSSLGWGAADTWPGFLWSLEYVSRLISWTDTEGIRFNLWLVVIVEI